MKLALVLLMSAVGFGQQAKPAEKCVEGPTRKEVSCPKLHKPKPLVKTSSDLYSLCRKNAGTVAQCKAEVAFFADPCDGIAGTGPVEMLPRGFPPEGAGIISFQDKAAVEGSCFRGNIDHENKIPCPDKAAVPVERELFKDVQANRIDIETYTGAVTVATVYPNPPETMVKLSDSEYSHLQQLRASVVEEEKRLAVKYGANEDKKCPGWHPGEIAVCNTAFVQPDHYEFHGQFLLIDKGGK